MEAWNEQELSRREIRILEFFSKQSALIANDVNKYLEQETLSPIQSPFKMNKVNRDYMISTVVVMGLDVEAKAEALLTKGADIAELEKDLRQRAKNSNYDSLNTWWDEHTKL